jgi:hypothetical protein
VNHKQPPRRKGDQGALPAAGNPYIRSHNDTYHAELMMGLLEFIEGSGIATWVRESPSIFVYTAVLSLHAIGLSVVVGVSAILAFRVLGRFEDIPLEPMFKLFPVMYIGFWVNVISGVLLLSANATGMLTMIMFYIKMIFVVSAVISLRLLRQRLVADGSASGARGLSWAMLTFWFLAIVAGRLTAYPYFVASWLGIGG